MPDTITAPTAGADVRELPLSRVAPSANGNPRTRWDDEDARAALEDLAASIRRDGVLQPPVVRSMDGGAWYEIIAGERRYRAAQLAGLTTIPCIVRDGLGDQDAARLALVENLQREDLTPIEEARAMQALLDMEPGLTPAALGERLGKAKSTITRALLLLSLPEPVQARIGAGKISRAAAEALARRVTDPTLCVQIADQVASEGLTTAQLETALDELAEQPALARSAPPGRPLPAPPPAAPVPPSCDPQRCQHALAALGAIHDDDSLLLHPAVYSALLRATWRANDLRSGKGRKR